MPSWSGFWGDGVGSSGAYTLLDGKMPRREWLRRTANMEGFRANAGLFSALIGAATGGTATFTRKRTTALVPLGGLGSAGGIMPVETVTDINRVTTAADVTALKEMLVGVKTAPTSYPRDVSGNGGGAFTPG